MSSSRSCALGRRTGCRSERERVCHGCLLGQSGTARAGARRTRRSDDEVVAPRWTRARTGASAASGRRAARRARGRRPSAEASGGEPRSSHEPSTRRVSSPRSASSPSAVETVGRRAPTSWPRMRWVSASGTITPSPETRPQRSARCQKQRLQPAVDARELRDRLGGGEAQRALAEAVEQRGGDLGPARQLGGEAAVEHGERGRGEHGPERRRRAAGCCARRSATGAAGRRGRAARR